MKKLSKVLLASTLMTGALIGTQALTPEQPVAHAAISPWYAYHGQTAFGGAFYLDGHFKNAVQHHGLTFNGYKISAPFSKKILNTSKFMIKVLLWSLEKPQAVSCFQFQKAPQFKK